MFVLEKQCIRNHSEVKPNRQYLLKLVGQLVDLQDEVLERMFGGSVRIQKQSQLLLRHFGTAMEHLKRLGNTSKYGDYGPDELAWREVLTGV